MKLDLNNAKITINSTDEIDLSDFVSEFDLTDHLEAEYPDGYEITDFENVPDDTINSTEVNDYFFDIRDHTNSEALVEIMDENGIDSDAVIDYYDEHYVGDSRDEEIEHYLGELDGVDEKYWNYIDYEQYWEQILRHSHTETESGHIFRD